MCCFRNALFAILMLFTLAPAAPAQQTYVTRFDVFGGYAFLDSPMLSLFENGFQTQVGVRPRTWYSLGFDYSYSRGSLTVTPDLLPTSLQQQVAAVLAALAQAGLLPPGYTLAVPADSVTHSFAIGPQLASRHFRRVTLFARPSIGAVREAATPRPRDPIAQAIVAQLVPAGRKVDWQGFYGFGYGIDIILTKHLAIRTQSDLVWEHLFNDILKNRRWTVRFSVGPAFNFGKNIAK
jgi:hypothetical protein